MRGIMAARPRTCDNTPMTTGPAPGPWDTGWRRSVPALQHRDFRILWIGMFFSSATMMFQFYAQGWFILGLTSSAALLGLLGVTRGSGMLIFGLFGGALADRMDRRRLLMVTQTAALVVYGVLSVLVMADRISLLAAFALIFVAASVESVDAPARQALLPHLVPREHIPNAVALFIAAQVSSYAFLPRWPASPSNSLVRAERSRSACWGTRSSSSP